MLIDLTKQNFKTLTVLKRVENSSNSRVSRWLCQCKKCNKKFIKNSWQLRKKDSKCNCVRIGQKHEWCWQGHEEISGAYWSKLKKGAVEREIKFNITIEEAWNQFIKQEKKCTLTGEKLNFIRNYKTNQINQTASLDRIDSSKDYTPDNIQWIHKDINRFKANFEESKLVELCRSVVYPNFDQINIIEKPKPVTFEEEYVYNPKIRGKAYDIISKRFHKLVVLNRAENLPHQRMSRFLCRCDCGNKKIIHGCKLIKGQIKSCGCSRHKKTELAKTWKGHGEISGTYWQKLKRANIKRKKDIQFIVTIEEAWDQFIKQNKRCAITGEQLIFVSDYSRDCSQTASLDRIDSNGHYEIGNIQWVHKNINRLKNDYDQQSFFNLCLKIVKFQEMKSN